jgi:sugar O-acyltransferase (sialic acid O-acetyltransferase NeuD family)
MKQTIVVIGAGGHGKVIADSIIAEDKYDLSGFVDASLEVGTEIINGYTVIEKQDNIQALIGKIDAYVIAVGNNVIRKKIDQIAVLHLSRATIIHPSAKVGSDVMIGSGTVVLANAVVNASSEIGINTIVNAGVIVDHDCLIGDYVHLSIGTMVGSNSVIEKGHTTSIGQSIQSFTKIINSDGNF